MAPARTRQADLSPYHVELGVSNDADGGTEPRHGHTYHVHRGGPPGYPRVHGAIHGNRQHTPTSSENGRARGAISWPLLFHSLALHSWRGLSQSIMGKKRLCRKIAFSRQNPKIVYWKINDLRVQTFLFSVICDRAAMSRGDTTSYVNGNCAAEIYKAANVGAPGRPGQGTCPSRLGPGRALPGAP